MDALTGNRTVEVNRTNLVLTNQNFTNMIGSGMLSGYKLNQEGTGLSGWTINVYYQNGTFFGSNVTNASGYFSFSPVTFGNYTLNETVQSGWELFDPGNWFPLGKYYRGFDERYQPELHQPGPTREYLGIQVE